MADAQLTEVGAAERGGCCTSAIYALLLPTRSLSSVVGPLRRRLRPSGLIQTRHIRPLSTPPAPAGAQEAVHQAAGGALLLVQEAGTEDQQRAQEEGAPPAQALSAVAGHRQLSAGSGPSAWSALAALHPDGPCALCTRNLS